MELPEQGVDRYQAIGQHEAGHFFVARAMGFRVEKVTLKFIGRGNEKEPPHRGEANIHLYRNLLGIDQVSKYLRDRISVLYAGALAEALKGHVIDEEIAKFSQETNAAVDVAKASEYLEMLLNVERGDDVSLADPESRRCTRNALCGELYQNAADVVMAHANAIKVVGAELARKAMENWGREVVLTVDEIDRLLSRLDASETND
ncbi:hypothetical protein [Paraburkholderia sp. J41]|uniref:hypothetical protein n=1 Tax=Paraburkholderia sp. J41 TaxID=2805433 RepID=UPI002AC34693|nr:hypothetical protein [Paraburkholderia sp. J41]